jgi:MFS transporter, DHA1 family, multidrug resistance protein
VNQHQHLVDSNKKFVTLIIILGSIIAIGPLAIDMYLPAFSLLTQSFNAPESKAQLSLTTYFIGLAVGQLFYGPIIDRFGKKPPLLCGLLIFTISSIACCYAKTIDQLIILRFFQAVGACAGTVVPRAIVRDIFSPQDSGRVFSHLMLVMGVAPILAPLLGSVILVMFGWKSIFVFLAIFGIFCMLVSHFLIPETKGPNKDEKISHAFKKYLGILKDRNFVVCTISGGLVMTGLFSYITGSPFIYLEFFGISSKHYGLIFSCNALSFVLASQINARLLKKFLIADVLKKTIFLPAIFGAIMIFVGFYYAEFWPITILFFAFLFSVGAIAPNSSALALSNQQAHSGSASALFGTLQFTLATIGSFAVHYLHNGEIFPITLVVGSCGILSCVVYNFFK